MSSPAPRFSWPTSWRPTLNHSAIPFLTALLAGLLWTRHLSSVGLRLTGDSGYFIQAAQRLFFDGVWDAPPVRPPLYSASMAAVMLVEPFAADAAALLSGICMTGSLLGLATLAWRTTGRARLSAVLVAILGIWPAYTVVFEVAWTEGLAGCLALLHIVALDHYRRHDHRGALHLAALCLGLGALTRFLGLAAIGVFGLAMLASTLRDRRHLLHRAAATVIALGLPAIWMLWSHFARGSATGERRPATSSWAHNLSLLADQCAEALMALPLLAVGGGLLCIAAVTLHHHRAPRSPRWMLEYTTAQVGFGLFAIVVATSRVSVDAIGPRYLAPLTPLVLVAMLFAWETLRPRLEERSSARIVPLAVTVVTALGLVAPFGQQLDATLKQAGQPSAHTHGGFSVSTTQQALAQEVAALLRHEDHANLILMNPEAAGRWMAFAWRRDSFAGLQTDLRRMTTVEPGWHTTLELDDGRTLSLLKAVPHSGRERAVHQLRRALRAVDGSAMVLVHTKSFRDLAKKASLQDLIGAGWTVEKVGEAAPYTLYSTRATSTALARAERPADAIPPAGPTPDDAAAPPAARTNTAQPSPFRHPGKHGIGTGWRPTRMDFLDNMRRDHGALVIDARADATSVACGPDVPVQGAAELTGRIRADGLNPKGFAEVTLTFRDADGKPIRDADNQVVVHRAPRITGTTEWIPVAEQVTIAGAHSARACVWVRGNAGRAWADAIVAAELEGQASDDTRDGVADNQGQQDTGR